MKPLIVLILSGAWLAGAAEPAKPVARPSLDSLFSDDVLAQGRGVKVTSSQLEQAYISYKANLAARGERIGGGDRTLREAQLLDRLIVTQILTNRATAADLAAAGGMAEKFMAESKKSAPNEDAFNRQLKAMSITPEQFRQRVRDQAVAEAVIERELKSTLSISDAEVQDFYKTGTDILVKAMMADLDAMAGRPSAKPAEIAALRERIDGVRKFNLGKLEQPEKVRITHIFLGTRDRKTEEEMSAEQKKIKRLEIEKLRTRALAGEDFMKLVQDFSEDRGLPETKGIYTFSRNDSFSPEFKSAAFSLEPGKISDVVSTPFGFHVLKVLEKTPAQKADFEKVAKELKDFLLQQALQKAMPEYFTKLKKEAGVEILEAKYRLDLKDTDLRVQP